MSILSTEYYTAEELSAELGLSTRTLGRWRAHGLGPPSIKLGRVRVYRRAAVEAMAGVRVAKPMRAHLGAYVHTLGQLAQDGPYAPAIQWSSATGLKDRLLGRRSTA